MTELPVGLAGLILAGIFAAAISSLDSILAALSQTTLSLFKTRKTNPENEKSKVAALEDSRLFWGIALSAFAIELNSLRGNVNVVNLAFGMISYTTGPMLGMFLAALFTPQARTAGIAIGFALSFLLVAYIRPDFYQILINFEILSAKVKGFMGRVGRRPGQTEAYRSLCLGLASHRFHYLGMWPALRKKSKNLNTPSLKTLFPNRKRRSSDPEPLPCLPFQTGGRKKIPSKRQSVFLPNGSASRRHADSGNPHLVVQKEILPCPEAYKLRISPNGITIAASQKTGIFRALTTLSQLMEGEPSPGSLPCIEVKDGPVLVRRGFMLGVSRCKVPTMKTIFGLIDLLAELRFNELQLYAEHTFAFRGHETVWKDASPLTGEEIRKSTSTARSASSNWFPT